MTDGAPVEGAGPDRGTGRRTVLLLTLLVVVAALLRFWYLPSSGRLASETRAVENVQAALAGSEARDHRISPLAWAPQLAVLRAADRLHESRDGRGPGFATARHRVTRRGLELARVFSVFYGAAGVLFLFLVARRLHTSAVGLLAAAALAFSPWHIQASVAFAPDVLVLTLSVLALWLALRAMDRPALARFGLVGLALGAAAAAKPSGALVALPVVLALAIGGRREVGRTLSGLAVALPLAALTWWLLTPPSGVYLSALDLEQATQTRRAAREMSSRFTVFVFALLHPLRDSVHGLLLGALALLGAAGQAFRCLFLVDPGPDRGHRLMVLGAWPTFALGYAWATPLFRESSFVPLVAYSSLYAAVMLAILWQGLVEMAPRLRGRRGAVLAALVALALIVPPGWRYVYSSAVPSTVSVALDWLRNEFGATGPRVVLVEEAALRGAAASAMQLARGLGLVVVPRLAAVDEDRLARADGQIFLRRELDGAEGEIYGIRRRAADRHRVVAASLLRRRGPDLVVAAHARGEGPPRELELPVEVDGKRRRATVPAANGEATTIALLLRLPPTPEIAPPAPRAWLDGEEIPLAPAGFFPRNTRFVSERLPVAAAGRRLRVQPPSWMAARRGEITVALYAWR